MNSKRSKIESSETPAVDRHTTADDDKDDKQEAVWVEVINCETSSPLRIAYSNVKSIGSGSFGVVYSATLGDNREVAIKKVLQDKRYKKPGETYLNLIQEYVPQTLSRLIRHYWRIRQSIPLVCVKVSLQQVTDGIIIGIYYNYYCSLAF
ncbi:unnamed protein product [Trichobilharzia regenti]|nr:unnamed protein product [Trichobilharzia regenti]